MKNMKLAFLAVFFILLVSALVCAYMHKRDASESGVPEDASASCGGSVPQRLSESDEAYVGAQEMMAGAKFDEAAKKLEDAIKKYPGEARLYNLLGQALMYKRDIERALAAFGKAVAFEPGNLKNIFDLASLQYKVELFEDAARSIESVDVKRVSESMHAVLAVNISQQNLLPESGIRWSDRALSLLDPETETETYNFIFMRKALFLSMLGNSDDSLAMLNQIAGVANNEEMEILLTSLKAGIVRWLGRKPGDREKMLVDMLNQTKNQTAADSIKLSQALIAIEDSKWSEAAAFLKKELPEPAGSDGVTKIYHYLMRQSINAAVLDKIGKSEESRSLIGKMKTWCENNSKGGGRILVSRCQMVDLLSMKNEVKEASKICMQMPPSLTASCLLNAGFGSEMNGDESSAWELYSKSAQDARYNTFPRKISRVFLKEINAIRKAANQTR